MITLLHGDNITASRNELTRLKQRSYGKEIRQLDGRSLDTSKLIGALESHSLFGGDTCVIIENLFGKLGRKQKLISELASILVDCGEATDVILWEDKEVSATVIKSLGAKAKVQIFKSPAVIFQFLDALKPGSEKTTLSLFAKTVSVQAPELIFAMITRRMRLLIQLRDNVTPDGLQGWQVSRLTSQAKSFTMDKLLDMYTRLLTLEYSIKSGTSPFPLKQQIELWLIDL